MRKKTILIWFIFCLLISFPLRADISVAPEAWDLGAVNSTSILSKEITIANSGSQPVTVSIVETCDCLYPDVKEIKLQSGDSRKIVLFFDPAEEQGAVEKLLIIENTSSAQEKILFTLHADVNSGSAEIKASPAAEPQSTPTETETAENHTRVSDSGTPDNLTVYLYYSFGCKSCERLLTSFFPIVEQKLGITLTIIKRDILQAASMREYESKLQQLGASMREFPALLLGSTLLQGEQEIRSGTATAAASALERSAGPSEKPADAASEKQKVLPELLFFPVLAAGLADGINPCAFSTLIFLIVSLAYVGRRKSSILLTGIFFTVAVFITYYLVGVIGTNFIYFFRSLPFAAEIFIGFKIVIIILLLVFAGLSIYDVVLIAQGRTREMVLQLPKSIKQRIHKSVRAYVSSLALISGALLLGFYVSVFELACTGQIYFPVIAALAQTESNVSTYFYLVIYNIGFILPLLLVFIFIYSGVSSEKITSVFQKHMGVVKIILAVVFVLLAVFIIVFT
ncbi:MAG: DUF1573 domain-containing protein [Spirochaetales bacterium]|nr:DUF1573 domain-containing protein [Spirochaetales bacterium]